MRALTALCLLILALAGCGGGGEEGQGTATQAKPAAKSAGAEVKGKAPSQAGAKGTLEPSPGPPARAFQPRPHRDSGGGSGQFTAPGGDNSVQEYGSEASGAGFSAAARALHDLLDARAQRNWAAACQYLSRGARLGLAQLGEGVPQLEGKGCPVYLGAVTGPIATSKLREAAIADVASVRVKGDRGFAIYRGASGQAEAVSMVREGGEWKVGSLGAVPLGSP